MRTDSGQAMMEFVIGIFALALLLSAFLVIGDIIPKATDSLSLVRFNAGLNALDGRGSAPHGGAGPTTLTSILDRGGAPYNATPLSHDTFTAETKIGDLSAQYLFGDNKFRTKESAYLPTLDLPKIERQSQMETIE